MRPSTSNVAPIYSASYNALLETARLDGQDAGELRRLLWLINAHPRLLCLRVIARNLHSMLSLIPMHMGVTLEELGMDGWFTLSAWIMDQGEKLVERVGDGINSKKVAGRRNPLLGQGAKRHPLYVALWNIHENPEHRVHFQLCVAHGLIAHVHLMQSRTTLDQYESFDEDEPILDSPYAVAPMGLGLRSLSKASALPQLLRLNPYRSPSEFAKNPVIAEPATREVLAGVDETAQRNESRLNGYVFFLEKVNGYRDWRSRTRDTGGSGGGEYVHGYVDVDLVDWEQISSTDEGSSGHQTGSVSVIYGRPDPGKSGPNAKELLLNDLDPGEFGDQAETYLIDNPPDDQQRSMAATRLSAKNQAKHLAMNSQFWPWQFEVLTCEEIHRVIAVISARLEALMATRYVRDKHQARENELDALVLALVCFWTGSPLSRAINARVYLQEDGKIVKHDLALLLQPDGGRPVWQILSQFPDYKAALDTASETSVRKRSRYVFVPDVVDLGGLFRRLAERRRKSLRKKTQLFGVTEKDARKLFNALIGRTDGLDQVTLTRWERTLFRAITTETSDVTDAVALTGTRNAVATTKSFYTTPRLGDLADLYCRVTQRLYQQCQLHGFFPSGRFEPLKLDPHASVGSRACARKNAVVEAVARLKADLRQDRRYQTWEEFRDFHNRFTFYTVQLVNFATGFRAVCTPFIEPQDRDESRQIALLSDKDNQAQNRRRIAYLPRPVIEQLAHYESHLAHLAVVADDQLVRDAPSEWPACFLLQDRVAQPVLPKTLRPWLQAFLGLPANAHRRFLRTELREAGCPPDILNAFMGHASQGEEAWGRFSSLSVALYRTEIARYMDPLLESLGFEPVTSRLVDAGGRS